MLAHAGAGQRRGQRGQDLQRLAFPTLQKDDFGNEALYWARSESVTVGGYAVPRQDAVEDIVRECDYFDDGIDTSDEWFPPTRSVVSYRRCLVEPAPRHCETLPAMTVRFVCRTTIAAPAARVFAQALSIDTHLESMATSNERAVAGVRTGRIGLGQSVTWRARHFGVVWTMTSQITELDEPNRFVDEQQQGPFRWFRHEHTFEQVLGATVMVDEVAFAAPLGPLGWVVERAALGWYLRRLIRHRGTHLKGLLEA